MIELSQPRVSKKKGGKTPVESAIEIFNNFKNLKKTVVVGDSHFMSAEMIKYLMENNIHYMIAVSASVLQEIFKKGLMKSVANGKTHAAKFERYICITTDSRKKVNLITNIYDVETTDSVNKTNARMALNFYDDHKRKADQFNFLFTTYLSPHVHHHHESTLLSGYISICMTQAFLVYQKFDQNPVSHKQFLLTLSKELLSRYK